MRWARTILVALAAALAVAPATAVGAGWAPPFPLGFTAEHVAMSPGGTSVYVGLARVGFDSIPAAQVRPPGGPLGDVQLLTDGPSNATPVVAAGPDGRFVAAWAAGTDIYTSLLPAGATTFDAAQTMPAEGRGFQPAISIDGSGTAHLVWFAATGDPMGYQGMSVRAGLRPASGAAPASQLLDDFPSAFGVSHIPAHVRIATSDAGAAIASWQEWDGGYAQANYTRAALSKPGEPFGAPFELGAATGVSPGEGPGPAAVAMNGSGKAIVAWSVTQAVGPDLLSTLHVCYGDISGLGADEGAGIAGADPAVAMAPDGRATVAFARWGGPQGAALQAAFRPSDAPLGPAQEVSVGEDSQSVSVSAGPAGQFLLAWRAVPLSNSIKAAVAEPGALFGPPSVVASGVDRSGLSLALGGTGDGVVIWQHNANGLVETDASGYDATAPALGAPTIPPSGAAGTPVSFSVPAPYDLWGPVTVSWDFGDGATATGTDVTHSYATGDNRIVTVTATDAAGNTTAASGPVSIRAIARDVAPPVITKLSLTHTTFAVGTKPTALSAARARPPRGTTLLFTLSESAKVKITIRRELAGLRKAGRCVKPTAALRRRHAKACTRLTTVGTLRRNGAAGRNRIPFSGRLGRKALATGRYQLTVGATDAAGNATARKPLKFRIVRSR